MPLNDLIKDYSLTTISQKTNIPIEVLDKLLNKEWESLQATKAKGFIAIIEREFNLDLSELKDEANEYYKTHQKEEPHRPIDLVDAQSISNGSKIVTNIVALFAFILVLYAIWFYFFKDKNGEIVPEDSNSSGLIKESINRAKNLVGIQDKKPQKLQESKKVVATTDNNKSEKEEQVTQTEPKEEPKKKFDITTDVQKSEKSIENNTTLNQSNTDNESNNSNEVINLATNNKKVEENSSINKEVESLLEENTTSKEEAKEELNSTQESNNTLTEDNQESNVSNEISATTINSITIKPTVKAIWVGIYDLKTHKRVPKLFSREYKFNTNGDDIAIVTGHSKFKIATDNGIEKKFSGKGRKYLYVSNEGIKEITKGEYRALTKRKAW
jgi:hypothetical protein